MMDYRNIELTYITAVYIENENCKTLSELINKYETYDSGLLKKIHFIFVDDHSPSEIKIDSDKINYTLVRIKDDIKWNQPGARNLGVFLAKSSKLILTDLDHVFPERLLQHLLKRKTPYSTIYRFRREKNNRKVGSHPNTFFCTKALFYRSLGVDEEFSGNYGYDDVYFLKLQSALGTKFKKIRNYSVILNSDEENEPDKDHSLVRDTQHNSAVLKEKLKYIKEKRPFAGHSRIHINFDWEIIKQSFF